MNKFTFDSTTQIVDEINSSKMWNTVEVYELSKELCRRAGLEHEWEIAEGIDKMEVFNKAASILDTDVKYPPRPYYKVFVLKQYVEVENGKIDDEEEDNIVIAEVCFICEKEALEFYKSIQKIIPNEDGLYSCYSAEVYKYTMPYGLLFYEGERIV